MGKWQKGQSGNPKGRTPILLPEIQAEVDRNKSAFKQLVLQYLNLTEDQIRDRQLNRSIPFVERILGQTLERIATDGDIQKFRMLLEIVFGRIPEEPKEMELSSEEKLMIKTYRERLAIERASLPDSTKTDRRDT